MAKAKMKASKRNTKVKANTKTKAKAKTKRKVKVETPIDGKKIRGFGRGYNVVITEKVFNFGNGADTYEVYEVSGPKVDGTRIFVDEDSVKSFIGLCDTENVIVKALSGKSHGGMLARGIIKEMADMKAAADLPEINTELPEKCDKTSVEDIDA
jgi:hypothetical protein